MTTDAVTHKPKRRWDLAPILLAILIVSGYFLALVFVLTQPILKESERVVDMMLGTLTAAFILVLNYFYGTNANSARKTDLIAKAGPVDTQ